MGNAKVLHFRRLNDVKASVRPHEPTNSSTRTSAPLFHCAIIRVVLLVGMNLNRWMVVALGVWGTVRGFQLSGNPTFGPLRPRIRRIIASEAGAERSSVESIAPDARIWVRDTAVKETDALCWRKQVWSKPVSGVRASHMKLSKSAHNHL